MNDLKIKDDEMNALKPLFAVSVLIGMMVLTACDHPDKNKADTAESKQAAAPVEKAEVLPYLNMKWFTITIVSFHRSLRAPWLFFTMVSTCPFIFTLASLWLFLALFLTLILRFIISFDLLALVLSSRFVPCDLLSY